jgi:hypothetical protein
VIILKGKQLIIIVLVIVAAGAGWFFLKGGSGLGGQKFSEKSPFTGSLKAAVALGVPMKCTYEENGTEYSGIIKGKQYKGTVVMQDGTEGTVIMKDNCIYTWSDVDNQGIKMCNEEEGYDMWEEPEEDYDVEGQSGEEASVDYVCYPTVATDAEFNLPSGVNFMDLDAMMNNQGFDY